MELAGRLPLRAVERLTMRSTRKSLVAIAATGILVLSGCAAGEAPDDGAEEQAPVEVSRTLNGGPLRILLTNDDGWGANGIVATYDALVAAGHEVTVVAPDENYSGVSSAVDFSGELSVEQHDEHIYSVSGTPATSVNFGLAEVLLDQAPDLVVSGANVGASTGFDQNFSGTIGAAVVASGLYDIPAIAISTATTYGDEESAAYEETATFLVDLLATGEVDIRSGEVLNINFPNLDEGMAEPEVRVAPAAKASQAAFAFEGDSPGVWSIVPARSEEETEAGTDSALLGDGFVTIDMIKVTRTVDPDRHAALEALATAVG